MVSRCLSPILRELLGSAVDRTGSLARDSKLIVAFDESKCNVLPQALRDMKGLGIDNQKDGLHYFKEKQVEVENFRSLLKTKVLIKDLAKLMYFLGIEVFGTGSKSEYKAMASVTSENIWTHKILKDLEWEHVSHAKLSYDSQAAIKIAINLVFHERTKHLEIDLHFVAMVLVGGSGGGGDGGVLGNTKENQIGEEDEGINAANCFSHTLRS
nr:copia protein [Tanacetum cinerariifolium]